jgi:hypothetical protein
MIVAAVASAPGDLTTLVAEDCAWGTEGGMPPQAARAAAKISSRLSDTILRINILTITTQHCEQTDGPIRLRELRLLGAPGPSDQYDDEQQKHDADRQRGDRQNKLGAAGRLKAQQTSRGQRHTEGEPKTGASKLRT